MSSSALKVTIPAETGARARRSFAPELAVRAALAALAVVVCYQFGWLWLRHWTLEMNAALDRLAGVVLVPAAADRVTFRGASYQYAIACTFADVWCGALPLLWSFRRTVLRNAALIAFFTIGLLAFNIVRLTFSDVIFAWGVPWDLAHNVVSGLAYFVVLEFVLKYGAWKRELRVSSF